MGIFSKSSKPTYTLFTTYTSGCFAPGEPWGNLTPPEDEWFELNYSYMGIHIDRHIDYFGSSNIQLPLDKSTVISKTSTDILSLKRIADLYNLQQERSLKQRIYERVGDVRLYYEYGKTLPFPIDFGYNVNDILESLGCKVYKLEDDDDWLYYSCKQ